MSGRVCNSPIELLDLEKRGGRGSRWTFVISFHSGDRGGLIFTPEVAEYVILKQVAGQRLTLQKNVSESA